MESFSLLGKIAESLAKGLAEVGSEKLRTYLEPPKSQEMLLDLYKHYYYLALRSEKFVSHFGELVQFVNTPKRDRAGPPETSGDTGYDNLAFVIANDIVGVMNILRETLRVLDRFAPILSIYDEALSAQLYFSAMQRRSITTQVEEFLHHSNFDRDLASLLNYPYEHLPETMDGLNQSYEQAKAALGLIQQSRDGLKVLIRQAYPTIKDLPV